MGDNSAAATAQPRQQRSKAEMRIYLWNRFGHRGPVHLMMDCCIGEQQYSILDITDLPVGTRKSSLVRQKSRERRSRRSGSRCIRTSSDVNFDTGFGIPVRKYPLCLEICSAGPPLQRITRSSRSRPSLHGMASGCVCAHRTRTPTLLQKGQWGCGAS